MMYAVCMSRLFVRGRNVIIIVAVYC